MNLNAVLPHCDVAIIHGGDATLYQCIKAGCAIVGVPGQGEQSWSLQRATNLGLGEEVLPYISAEDLDARLGHWIERREAQKELLRVSKKKLI